MPEIKQPTEGEKVTIVRGGGDVVGRGGGGGRQVHSGAFVHVHLYIYP